MKAKTRWLVVVLLSVVVALGGCGHAKFLNTSAATVGAAADVYDIGMQVVADLQSQGFITAKQREDINKIATIVYNAINMADKALIAYNDALLEYNKEETTETSAELKAAKVALKASLDFIMSAWLDLANLVNSIRPDTLPLKLTLSDVAGMTRLAGSELSPEMVRYLLVSVSNDEEV